MAWKEQLHPKDERYEWAYGECKVRKCLAENCKYNKDFKCTLPQIEITKDGRCKQYTDKPDEDTRSIGQRMMEDYSRPAYR